MTDLPAPFSALHPDRSRTKGAEEHGGGPERSTEMDRRRIRGQLGVIGVAVGGVTCTDHPCIDFSKAAESRGGGGEAPVSCFIEIYTGRLVLVTPPPITPECPGIGSCIRVFA